MSYSIHVSCDTLVFFNFKNMFQIFYKFYSWFPACFEKIVTNAFPCGVQWSHVLFCKPRVAKLFPKRNALQTSLHLDIVKSLKCISLFDNSVSETFYVFRRKSFYTKTIFQVDALINIRESPTLPIVYIINTTTPKLKSATCDFIFLFNLFAHHTLLVLGRTFVLCVQIYTFSKITCATFSKLMFIPVRLDLNAYYVTCF